MKLLVLGGSSFGTIALLAAISRAVAERRLPGCVVCLYGRNHRLLHRIERLATEAFGLDPRVVVCCSTDLSRCAPGATHILSQIRPGGMAARAADERFCFDCGVPADEGLGLGGILSFLRSRDVMANLAEQCARLASGAVFLQMSSPLGPMVAAVEPFFPGRTFGVCELPRWTLLDVLKRTVAHLPAEVTRSFHAGINHLSWAYGFRNSRDDDLTAEVIASLVDEDLFGISRSTIIGAGAIPVPYLRLYFHMEQVVAEQRSRTLTRGEQLVDWRQRLLQATTGDTPASRNQVASLLAERRMDWYEDGVIPLLEALLDSVPRELVLNLPNQGALPGLAASAIVEVTATVAAGTAAPIDCLPPLPDIPAELTWQLVAYEKALLATPNPFTIGDVLDLVQQNPLVPTLAFRKIAETLDAHLARQWS